MQGGSDCTSRHCFRCKAQKLSVQCFAALRPRGQTPGCVTGELHNSQCAMQTSLVTFLLLSSICVSVIASTNRSCQLHQMQLQQLLGQWQLQWLTSSEAVLHQGRGRFFHPSVTGAVHMESGQRRLFGLSVGLLLLAGSACDHETMMPSVT